MKANLKFNHWCLSITITPGKSFGDINIDHSGSLINATVALSKNHGRLPVKPSSFIDNVNPRKLSSARQGFNLSYISLVVAVLNEMKNTIIILYHSGI
jgi:hypothetical protein